MTTITGVRRVSRHPTPPNPVWRSEKFSRAREARCEDLAKVDALYRSVVRALALEENRLQKQKNSGYLLFAGSDRCEARSTMKKRIGMRSRRFAYLRRELRREPDFSIFPGVTH